MARMARLVVPNFPHHVVQRGARRQRTFFCETDYLLYRNLLIAGKQKAGVDVWGYCFMPNHVHLVVVPKHKDALARLFSDVHRQYTRRINLREDWQGHLWQERFHSFVMDEDYLRTTIRYVELNPTRAGLCCRPEQWSWSSAAAHLRGEDDGLVDVEPMLERVGNWRLYLAVDDSAETEAKIRRHTRSGRPVGDEAHLETLERVTGRKLHGDSLLFKEK